MHTQHRVAEEGKTTRQPGAINLTARYLLTFLTLGALALANYLILRTQIETSRAVSAVVAEAGRQRSLLQRSALLAQKLVAASPPVDRARLRAQLRATIEPLRATREELSPDSPGPPGSFPEVKAIYLERPWLLGARIEQYVAHARALADSPDRELHWASPDLEFIEDAAMGGAMVDALDAVVAAYQRRSDEKTAYLQGLALWSFGSVIAVLGVSGLLVFRPMVERVRRDMETLRDFSDMLEQRVAERTALADQRAAALSVSEALYRSLVDHLPLYVLRKNLEGRFTFANDSFCQLLGRSRQEILGKTDVDFYPQELAAKYVRDDRDVIGRGRIFRAVEEHLAADGERRHVEVLKTPVYGADGRAVETQTVFLDVTDRVEAERRLVETERLAAIGEMVAGVAHESRNALQQIQACGGLLRWRIDGDQEAAAILLDLQRAQDRLLRLFEDLRGYAARVTLELRPCDVREVVAEAWATLTAAREGRNAVLRDVGDNSHARCLADPLRLQQVFCNLLENALGACADPVLIEVEVGAGRIGDAPAVQVVLRDDGPGFTPEQQQRAFEPFFTTKTSGTGLGMVIAKRIVEAHQGRITLGNRPVRGAEVCVILPRGEV